MAEYVVDFYSEHDGVKCEEVVRCRDCKHATDDGYGCKLFSHYERGAYYQWEDVPAEVEPNGFCKWGERRTDA